MKKLLMFFVIILIAAFASVVSAEDKIPMPDLTKFKINQERTIGGYCEHIPIYVENYMEINNDDNNHKAVVNIIYVYFDNKTAVKPFIVAIQNPKTLLIEKVYLDLDKDGIVDVSGKPGDPQIGDDPCYAHSRLK